MDLLGFVHFSDGNMGLARFFHDLMTESTAKIQKQHQYLNLDFIKEFGAHASLEFRFANLKTLKIFRPDLNDFGDFSSGELVGVVRGR